MQNSPLLALPGELRNAIWRYALVEEDAVVIRPDAIHRPRPLLAVCKQIREEAVGIYFAENTFRCDCQIKGVIRMSEPIWYQVQKLAPPKNKHLAHFTAIELTLCDNPRLISDTAYLLYLTALRRSPDIRIEREVAGLIKKLKRHGIPLGVVRFAPPRRGPERISRTLCGLS